jgi:hypothetical protein
MSITILKSIVDRCVQQWHTSGQETKPQFTLMSQRPNSSPQWNNPSSPGPKNVRQVRSMLVSFYDCEGIVHHKFVPPGQTVMVTEAGFFPSSQFSCQYHATVLSTLISTGG